MKDVLCMFFLGIIIILSGKTLELYDITQNNQNQILDLGERSHYIGCRRVILNRTYCKELSFQWRNTLSKNLGIKNINGSILNED